MAQILPRDLTAIPGGEVNPAAAVIVDNIDGVFKATPAEVVNSGAPINSQAEAEAGVVNTGRMSPLRVAQAIAALGLSADVLAAPNGATLVGSFDSANIDPAEAYSGTGTATLGAPRWYLGNLTPSGDDSAFCIGRNISGNLLFSHAIRDESEFVSTGDSAYTSLDASVTYKSNGGAEYNHGYGFQWRSLMSATNGMDLFAGFVSFPRISAGTVDRLFHFHAQGWNKTGGTVSSHQGFYCSPLTADVGVAHAFFAESNPSFFGGYVQMDGDDLFGFGQARGEAAHFKGTVTSFEVGGGVFVGGEVTGAGYAEIRAYEWDGSTLGPRGLALNTNGGQVLIGAGAPTTGADLEVDGRIASATLTLSGLPTYADDTAAGVGGLTAGQVYKTAAGALMVKL